MEQASAERVQHESLNHLSSRHQSQGRERLQFPSQAVLLGWQLDLYIKVNCYCCWWQKEQTDNRTECFLLLNAKYEAYSGFSLFQTKVAHICFADGVFAHLLVHKI